MTSVQSLVVRTLSRRRTRGMLQVGGLRAPCALGRSGSRVIKREGDGATPIGAFAIVRVHYRRDLMLPPRTGLRLDPIGRRDGWCDAPGDRNYNRPVELPYPASAEQMWRADSLYDIVVVLAHNQRPRIRGGGSAIFMHLARPSSTPTEGCIALGLRDLRLVLARLRRGARVVVMP